MRLPIVKREDRQPLLPSFTAHRVPLTPIQNGKYQNLFHQQEYITA